MIGSLRGRRISTGGLLTMLVTGLAVPLLAASARPSVEGPLPGHTGGFGEPTCSACHMGPEDEAGARVRFEGLPAEWEPGAEYRFAIVVEDAELGRAGFQVAARFADGAAAGEQAGDLKVDGDGGRTSTTESGVQYAHHVYDGTTPVAEGVARWTLVWVPPSEAGGNVAFHVAANAANDDNSEFGDRIVTAAHTVAAK